MPRFEAREIAKAAGGRLVPGAGSVTRGVAIDSRGVKRGSLFVAIKGKRFDGHAFVGEAFDKGARAAVVSDPSIASTLPGRTLIVVDDTVNALQEIAALHRRRFRALKLIAVTGSNGKTTVKDMTAAALSRKFKILKTEGNLNNHIGLPLTLLRLTARHEAAVVEIGMNVPGEIARLTSIARPSVGVITNVGPAHIGNFRSLSAVRAAKGEMIGAMPEGGTMVLNADDANSRPLIEKARRSPCKVVTFGRGPGADVCLVDSWANGGLGRFAAIYSRGVETVAHIPLLGARHVENALAAFAAASLAGARPEEIAEGIAKVKPAAMRMQPLKLPNGALLINDAYNANPVSAAAALETLRDIGARERIFVFGDMLELGRRAEAEHKKVGRLAARMGVDRMYAIGKLARLAAREAAGKGVRAGRGASAAAIAISIARAMRPGDVALVKGSRGMRMEIVADELVRIMEER